MANALTRAVAPINDLGAWLKHWAERPIPIFQSSKSALAKFAGRGETARLDEVSAIILRDPLLMAHSLRRVNAREKSALATEVASIEAVLMLVGVDNFCAEIARLPTVESQLQAHAPHLAALQREVTIARLSARLASEFGMLRYEAHPEEVFVSALFAHLPRALQHLDAAQATPVPVVDSQEAVLPLFKRWEMPEVFSQLLNPEHGADTDRIRLQQALVHMAEAVQLGWWQAGVNQGLKQASEILGVGLDQAWGILRRVMLDFARNDWPYPQVFPPARWLPMLPGEWPQPKPKAEPVTNSPVLGSAPAPEKLSYAELLAKLQEAGQSGASFNQIMTLAIRVLAEGLHFKRILFCLLEKESNAIKTRYAFGAAQDDPLRAMQVSLDGIHLVAKLMSKSQSIWLNDGNRPQFDKLLPANFKQAVGGHDFMAMSLFVNDKPIGMFFADAHGGGLLQDQYAQFKQVCLSTGQCLSRKAKRLDMGH